MNAPTRRALTTALSTLSAAIAADIRGQVLAGGPAEARARRVHAEEGAAEPLAWLVADGAMADEPGWWR